MTEGAMTGRASLSILIATVQVPFTRGGAEILAERLRAELSSRGHLVDLIQLPFSAQPKTEILSQISQWRSLALESYNGRKVDLVIATKFPSYCVSHPCKVVWLVHQHRQIYDLYDSRFGDFTTLPEDEALRRLILRADKTALAESRKVFTISPNVTSRLKRYLDLPSEPLLPPLPLGGRYRRGGNGGYVLSVGRLCSIKRIDLMLRALPLIDSSVTLKIVGVPDEPGIQEYLQSEIDKHHLWSRVQFLGRVADEELLGLYAEAFAVYYAPYDEDYGFVTLEALASGKPVIAATDSGGVLSFVQHELNGMVAAPDEASIAAVIERLRVDSEMYQRLCAAAAVPDEVLNWDRAVDCLTAPAVSQG